MHKYVSEKEPAGRPMYGREEKIPQATVDSLRNDAVEKAVIPGFYGAGPDGKVVTFSRGGSDITGSIVSKACHASVCEDIGMTDFKGKSPLGRALTWENFSAASS